MQAEIERRAYALWEADGRPEGVDQAYWFKAVSELASETAAAIKPIARKRAPRVKKAA
jgi:hypothetical protein